MKAVLRYITFGVAALQVSAAMAGNFASLPKTQTSTAASSSIDWNKSSLDYVTQGNAQKNSVEDLMNRRKHYNQEDIERVTRAKMQDDQKRMMLKGQVISIDTRDQEACLAIQKELQANKTLKAMNDVSGLCIQDNQKPIATVTVLSQSNEVQWQRELNISKYTSTDKNIITSTRNVALAALGVAGVLYLMPESVSKWDKSKMKNLPKNWEENVKAGPHMDKDDWMINYIGHPYSGAAYYQVARNEGLSMMQSFGYSVLMSTFFWEFGVEAFAEQPSIQDLFATPIVGSILGEIFYRAELKIKANNGELLGSKRLGAFAMIVMNPMGVVADKINDLIGTDVVQDARAHLTVRKAPTTNAEIERGNVWGIEMQFRF
ncbi:DUF3943 domain-containing protein [Bdellovibrio sp. KM01]|uniref:DUF3943 domain-containing protein n=1 Tax=Bdellovibrio sp. KM01 TaxID=2748865 RepID=UPI0015E8EFFC|nr:DUF3943 domain-containing protein [Bdellovibrio sp. KM01]QLY24248.1 DUF3943 domain-containing protein [Bdellovibrio sp. KM01]